MSEYRLPSLGADMDEATFVEWRVKPGDRVKRGDIVAAVETSKGIIDIEIFEAGVVESLLVEPGAKIPVGSVLAQIRSDPPGAAAAPAPSPAGARPALEIPAPPVPPPSRPQAAPARAPTQAPADRPRASPAARKHASELGVALESLQGSGPHGVITVADVDRAQTGPASHPLAAAAAQDTPVAEAPRASAPAAAPTDMRAAIAAAMARSKREIPHYYLSTRIDLQRALDWLAVYNAAHPVTERLLAGLLFVRAVARALDEFADFNGHYVNGRFRPGNGVHVGVAVSLRGGGLVAPALHDANQGALAERMPDFQDLVTRARSGRLRASEMADPTITVTSLGERGVDAVFPVIYPPQVAIVGFGRVGRQPVVTADGGLAAHPVVQASLAADHRVGDGHRGGLFLAAIERALQSPETL